MKRYENTICSFVLSSFLCGTIERQKICIFSLKWDEYCPHGRTRNVSSSTFPTVYSLECRTGARIPRPSTRSPLCLNSTVRLKHETHSSSTGTYVFFEN